MYRKEEFTQIALKNLCTIMPHVIDSKATEVIDEWKVYQKQEISPDMNVPLDKYFIKVFELTHSNGFPLFTTLEKLIKSCLSIQNGNAAVERRLSDNKNCLTDTRTNLSEEALIGLRMKDKARKAGGAEKVNTSREEMVTCMKNAHKVHEEIKKLEKAERKAKTAEAQRKRKLQEEKEEEIFAVS